MFAKRKEKNMKFVRSWKSLLLGGILLYAGIFMATQRLAVVHEGTKGRNAAIGAVSGGVLGGGAAALVGGIGIVACGTGFGIPAGVPLIILASAVGAGVGGVAGAATGKSSYIEYVDAYPLWLCVVLISIGCLFLFRAFSNRKQTPQPPKQID